MLARSQATEVAKEDSNDSTNPAMFTPTRGGIDFNPTNFNLLIKRDGNGVPLPLSQQDMAQLMQVEGFIPVILAITPALNVPILTELQHQLQPALR